MKAFNSAILGVADALLASNGSTAPLGQHCEATTYGDVTFVSNTGWDANDTEAVSVAGVQLLMPNHTVVILRGSAVVFNTSAAPDALASPPPPVAARVPVEGWVTIAERVGFGNVSAAPAAGQPPLEMLALTRNSIDYMYYTLAAAPVPANASAIEVSTCGGEYVYVFAGDALLAPVAPSSSSRAGAARARDTHLFALPHGLRGVAANLSVLVSAMGLSTSPTPTSCKGLRRVKAGAVDLTNAGWVSRWRFAGEAARVYTPAGAAAATWERSSISGGSVPTSWFKTSLDLPTAAPAALAAAAAPYPPGAPPQLAYALDLQGATKGVAWVNGFNIGRYDLELGACDGPCAPPIHGGHCFIFWRNCGQPTQRFYHVPAALLKPTGNLIVLFEETAYVPDGGGPVAPSPPPVPAAAAGAGAPPTSRGALRNLSTVAIVALTAHP